MAGVINTEALHNRILAALSKGLFGGRNIHRAPFLIGWPSFDPADSLHLDIAETARQAEIAAATVIATTGGIAAARNRVRDALEQDGVGARLEQQVELLLAAARVDAQLEQTGTGVEVECSEDGAGRGAS